MEQFNQDEIPSDSAAGDSPAYPGVPPRNNEAALFVGGLSFSATEDDLRNVCLYSDTAFHICPRRLSVL